MVDCLVDPPEPGYLRPPQGLARSTGSQRKRSCRPAFPRNLTVVHEPAGPLADARRTWKPRVPTLRWRPAGPTTCLSSLHALAGAPADAGPHSIADAWSSTWFMSRNVEVRCRPGEETSAELGAGLGVLSPSTTRRGLRGLPGWPGAPVTHRTPVWEQRAHGAVLFSARRHRTRFALYWSQAERLTAALSMLSILDGSRWDSRGV